MNNYFRNLMFHLAVLRDCYEQGDLEGIGEQIDALDALYEAMKTYRKSQTTQGYVALSDVLAYLRERRDDEDERFVKSIVRIAFDKQHIEPRSLSYHDWGVLNDVIEGIETWFIPER